MNKANLKTYAPQARKDFMAAIAARANSLGLALDAHGELHIAPAQTEGGVTVIAGQSWPVQVARQREQLIARMQRSGFAQTVEAIAYTWFNRFAALRYMELHDFLGHGQRALSSTAGAGAMPDLLTHAADLAHNTSLPGLDAAQVVELKLAGNRDNELYRLLLVAQCNALSSAMPFLFERIDDDTELLLPGNLLRSDSIIAKLVAGVPEEDWQEIEVIGWLYQFYISEKKDQVIGKVVKSEDIPAATQLFTPNWIVQYLVQNSVGRLWLMANPSSPLASEWPYYIQPAEQTPEVQAQLDALIQTRIDEDSSSSDGSGSSSGVLNPESITCLDPACGSGHILVVAYDVLKAIYLERGYRLRDIPRLILEKNLYGLDIDERAAQMAGFALLMKARADDRRLFSDPTNPPRLNVLALQDSQGLDAEALHRALPAGAVPLAGIAYLVETFAHAKTFGSLIQIAPQPFKDVRYQLSILKELQHTGDLYAQQAAKDLLPLVQQALILGGQFDAVVANPPYMGGKGMNAAVKEFAKANFPDSKADLFAMFMERGFALCKPSGFNSMVTMQSWMFLSSYQAMREKLLTQRTITTMAHLGARAFSEISGEVVQTTAFVLQGQYFTGFKPVFFRLIEGQEAEKDTALLSNKNRFDTTVQDDFKKIPGSPVAYWVKQKTIDAFECKSIAESVIPKQGLATGNNEKYLRFWWEVDLGRTGFVARNREDAMASKKIWFPYSKGGESRKWYGSNEYVVYFPDDGDEIRNLKDEKGNEKSRFRAAAYYFQEALTWSLTSSSSGTFSARYRPSGFVFDINGMSAFGSSFKQILSLLNSVVGNHFLELINPTMAFQVGDISRVPVVQESLDEIFSNIADACISISKENWDAYETSWDFSQQALVQVSETSRFLANGWTTAKELNLNAIEILQKAEEENNRLFIEAYNLQDELSPEVPESQITLTRADREKDCQRLISYAIGCMMGRYSLDEPGLIYAHAGNIGFDASRYATFPADADGIVPITDTHWFSDDAAERVREFLLAVWGADTLDENMAWLAESLGTKAGETPSESIRRYVSDKFFKDHLQTYKKRPIYWHFSSGKQGAFQALVYLHRYNESTLARLRSQYVVPLTGKLQTRIDMLQKDAQAASSTAARTKLNKEIDKLHKKHAELLTYDEKLRHHADLRITLDLDDGVKVNYGKFGDLLAEVKAVTGGAGDD